MADLTFITIRQSVPDAVAVKLTETSAIDVVKWCKGRIGWEEDKLILHYPELVNNLTGHPIGYASPQWGVAELGNWIMFNGERFSTLTDDELSAAWKVHDEDQ